MSESSPFRSLPPVHVVLDSPELAGAIEAHGRAAVLESVRRTIDVARVAIRLGRPADSDPAGLARRSLALLSSGRAHLRPVLNATGILLNTGLGRAPLAEEAVEAIGRVARGYTNLETDLDSGDRGSRTSGVEPLLCRMTGAEGAAVVNNNAAATVLALRALATGREVVVSRGQLVEIGGSFRLPEIFEVSGARLKEVGTTNRTRHSDYERAIGPDTAALLRVHPSNFRVVGFTESVGIAELAGLARDRGLWSIDDVGSGMLRPGWPVGVDDEPTVADGVTAGADVVLCSGDKLLGGPQCGLLFGKRSAIDRIVADPLMRAFRVDKMTLAALEATLRLVLRGDSPPLWRMLAATVEAIESRAVAIVEALREVGYRAEVVPAEAMLGGGSTPAQPIPSRAVRLAPPYPGRSIGLGEADFARSLRTGEPPVVGRVRAGALLLDLRAIPPAEDAALIGALARAV